MKGPNFVRPSLIQIDRISLPAMLLATALLELERSQKECEIAEINPANSTEVNLGARADAAFARDNLKKNLAVIDILKAELSLK